MSKRLPPDFNRRIQKGSSSRMTFSSCGSNAMMFSVCGRCVPFGRSTFARRKLPWSSSSISGFCAAKR
jgi:hypothetical protein